MPSDPLWVASWLERLADTIGPGPAGSEVQPLLVAYAMGARQAAIDDDLIGRICQVAERQETYDRAAGDELRAIAAEIRRRAAPVEG